MKYKLGEKVRDKISGLVGITVSRTEFLNGCIQYGVQPKIKKGATEIPNWNIDEDQLVSLEKKVKVKKKRNGGPTHKIVALPFNTLTRKTERRKG